MSRPDRIAIGKAIVDRPGKDDIWVRPLRYLVHPLYIAAVVLQDLDSYLETT